MNCPKCGSVLEETRAGFVCEKCAIILQPVQSKKDHEGPTTESIRKTRGLAVQPDWARAVSDDPWLATENKAIKELAAKPKGGPG